MVQSAYRLFLPSPQGYACCLGGHTHCPPKMQGLPPQAIMGCHGHVLGESREVTLLSSGTDAWFLVLVQELGWGITKTPLRRHYSPPGDTLARRDQARLGTGEASCAGEWSANV